MSLQPGTLLFVYIWSILYRLFSWSFLTPQAFAFLFKYSAVVSSASLCFCSSAVQEWGTADTDSVQSMDVFRHPSQPNGESRAEPSTPQGNGGVRLHEFVSKTVGYKSF